MSKPDDIPQDVWDASKEVWFSMPPLQSWETVVAFYARAILAAKAEEREEVAAMADRWAARYRNGADGSGTALIGDDAMTSFAAAIRARKP